MSTDVKGVWNTQLSMAAKLAVCLSPPGAGEGGCRTENEHPVPALTFGCSVHQSSPCQSRSWNDPIQLLGRLLRLTPPAHTLGPGVRQTTPDIFSFLPLPPKGKSCVPRVLCNISNIFIRKEFGWPQFVIYGVTLILQHGSLKCFAFAVSKFTPAVCIDIRHMLHICL